MIKYNELESIKTFCDIIADMIPEGIMFLNIKEREVVWKKATKKFDMDIFYVGSKISNDSIACHAMSEDKIVTEKIPRSLYGRRLITIAIPVGNESGKINGCFSAVFPKLHPVAAAFEDFAPILADMFHEGAFIYMTDLEKVAYRQPSEKFDMPSISIGYEIKETDIAFKAIKSKQPQFIEIDASKYGEPVLVVNHPLYDEDNGTEVVATLGFITPKKVAFQLREISENVENGLTDISKAIEQLAVSASEIHTNEQQLNSNIEEIITLSEEINEVSTFIKKVANETKMLGLNASIEAARAGEAGKGFSVVASEIRKLSEQSISTVPRIKKLTDDIKMKVTEVSEKSKDSLASSQEQASATEEITASVQEITARSEELSKVSKLI